MPNEIEPGSTGNFTLVSGGLASHYQNEAALTSREIIRVTPVGFTLQSVAIEAAGWGFVPSGSTASITAPENAEEGAYYATYWLNQFAIGSVTVDGVVLFGYLGYPYRVDFTVIESGVIISATSDHDGVGYTAVKEGTAIVIKQYPAGKASAVLKNTLPGYDNPNLYQLSDSTRFFLAARNKATGEHVMFYSDDFCVSFQVGT